MTAPAARPGALPSPWPSHPDRKAFRYRYEGPPRPLRAFLEERYGFGRSTAWAATFYPERVRLNGEPVDAATTVQPGDAVAYLHRREDEPPLPGPPQVLHEDAWMLVLYKPDVVPVSPSGVYYFTSLAILARETFANPELTPIHRLDLETAGPLVFAKRRGDLKRFHRLFQQKLMAKRYRALVHGAFPAALREIDGAIVPDAASAVTTRLRLAPAAEGRPTLTRIHRVEHHGAYSELELEPVTGRTNQLRVHLAGRGYPIVGDKKYHPEERVFLDWYRHRDLERLRAELPLPRQALLCQALAFPHPITGEPFAVQAPTGSWAAKVAPLVTPRLPDPAEL